MNVHDMLSQKFTEMHSALGEQMRSAIDSLEEKVSDVVIGQLQLITQVSFLIFLHAIFDNK